MTTPTNLFKSISKRIFFGVSILVVTIFALGLFAINSVDSVNKKTNDIGEGLLPHAISLGSIDANVSDYSVLALSHNLTSDPQEMNAIEQSMDEKQKEIESDAADF